MRTPLVIAHRGDSSRALENSLDAIRLALSVPADMIEVDIRKSRDDQLYLMHDGNTGRTADRAIDIEHSTSEDIAEVRLNNGEPVPTLKDAVDLIQGRVALNIEVKSDGAGAGVARFFHGSRYNGAVFLSSSKEAEIAAVRAVMPALPVACILKMFTPEAVSAYKEKGYRFISLKKKTVSEELVTACHTMGIGVYVWTVDEEEDMRRFVSWDVDGIYTNRPAVLKGLLESGPFSGTEKKI